MIRISLNRQPVKVPLAGAFAGCTITLRRLTSNEFAEATAAAQAVLRDSSKLVELLEQHDLRPPKRKIKDLLLDVRFMLGVSEWLAAIECGERAISAWSGFVGEDGKPIVPAAPGSSEDERKSWRAYLEAAFLSRPFMDQVLPKIDAAAQLLAVEGKGSGVSQSGSPALAPTASPLTTATTAGSATSPAPPVSRAETGRRARKSSTPRRPKKAPPSGG